MGRRVEEGALEAGGAPTPLGGHLRRPQADTVSSPVSTSCSVEFFLGSFFLAFVIGASSSCLVVGLGRGHTARLSFPPLCPALLLASGSCDDAFQTTARRVCPLSFSGIYWPCLPGWPRPAVLVRNSPNAFPRSSRPPLSAAPVPSSLVTVWFYPTPSSQEDPAYCSRLISKSPKDSPEPACETKCH